MKLLSAALSTVLLGLLITGSAQAKSSHRNSNSIPNPSAANLPSIASSPAKAPSGGDLALVQAVASKQNVDFIEASGVAVTELLADDTQGLPHEKFMVRLSDGASVLCVYNLDMGQRIPLKVGDIVDLGGQFKWTNVGPLMHWLHADPQHRRPDGYVELAGKRYGLN